MERINTRDVEKAFGDLISELQNVKDLSQLASTYKDTADKLAKDFQKLSEFTATLSKDTSKSIKDSTDYLKNLLPEFDSRLSSLGKKSDEMVAKTESINIALNKFQTDIDKLKESTKKEIASKIESQLATIPNTIKESVNKSYEEYFTKSQKSLDESAKQVSKSLDERSKALGEHIESSNKQLGETIAQSQSDTSKLLKEEVNGIEKTIHTETDIVNKGIKKTRTTLIILSALNLSIAIALLIFTLL